ncbi:class I SAM-dependent methyltransferase [Gloeobacter morelensis]|uniref:Class I SAM-dependent methyltransferase n=1 Tax=Gloeobacter morelensis MG652769 TaxID=2781736 RepID=A0ABY3PS17_9CYAN|nr:class I SAM-dependent methyltransferase [Gloeobacter morelensis]UFP96430.1 class I SAM-dependent methyltransferase [Gloeobacter morelensis MG652769]
MNPAAPVTARLVDRLVGGMLTVEPVFNLARHQARRMMIRRAESVGVAWRKRVTELRSRDWQADLAAVENGDLLYPEYYRRPFHAYDLGNLCWEAAFEVEVAAYAAHARIWPDAGAGGDARLRKGFLAILKAHRPGPVDAIVDLGCSIGMSTFALQSAYPEARLAGIDLSPHFLAVARHRAHSEGRTVAWRHAAAERTGLPEGSVDLVCAFLLFHELPAQATCQVLREAHRLLRPGGTLAVMDMNPRSDVYTRMPLYVLTLLKSTEPYLDEYFGLDLEAAISGAGFAPPSLTCNTPRHRTLIARRVE